MAHPGNAVVAGILEYSYLLMSIYMVVIHPVSLDSTIYMLGVVAIEVSRLIGTYVYVHYLRLVITDVNKLKSFKC